MKKILVFLLTLILLITPLSVNVTAAKTPTFVVGSATGKVGDTVQITVSTKENTGIISMQLLLKYDSKALQVVESEDGEFKNVAFSPKERNPFIVTWVDSINPDNKTNGVVATITFKILDTAPNGKSEISLSYDQVNVFDSGLNDVVFAIENGYVDITNPNPQQNTPSQDNSSQDTSSDVMIDTTTSDILDQIQNSANQNNSQTDLPDTPKDYNWIVWVVIGAIVVLVGAFAVVIIKGKKEE